MKNIRVCSHFKFRREKISFQAIFAKKRPRFLRFACCKSQKIVTSIGQKRAEKWFFQQKFETGRGPSYQFLLLCLMVAFSFDGHSKDLKKGRGQCYVDLFPAGDFVMDFKIKGKASIKNRKMIPPKKLTISVSSIKTGIDLRDQHTKKAFGNKNIKISNISKKSDGSATFSLKVNGVTQTIGDNDIRVSKNSNQKDKKKSKNDKLRFKAKNTKVCASFNVYASEFNMKNLGFNGIGVQDLIRCKGCVGYKKKK